MVIVAYGLERLGCHGERGVCGSGDGEELRGHKGEGRREVMGFRYGAMWCCEFVWEGGGMDALIYDR